MAKAASFEDSPCLSLVMFGCVIQSYFLEKSDATNRIINAPRVLVTM